MSQPDFNYNSCGKQRTDKYKTPNQIEGSLSNYFEAFFNVFQWNLAGRETAELVAVLYTGSAPSDRSFTLLDRAFYWKIASSRCGRLTSRCKRLEILENRLRFLIIPTPLPLHPPSPSPSPSPSPHLSSTFPFAHLPTGRHASNRQDGARRAEISARGP